MHSKYSRSKSVWMISPTVVALSICMGGSAFAAGEKNNKSWSYTGERGPHNWALLEEGFQECGVGLQQSPIDIVKTTKTVLPALQINWQNEDMTVLNKGLTAAGKLNGKSSMMFGDTKYKLVHFHVHAPSEHTIEGRAYPMEIHFVHQHPETKALGVLGVLIEGGGDNQAFSTLDKAMPKTKEAEPASLKDFNIRALLPSSLGYWSYEGSLTTPPCSEGVSWRLLKEPIKVSDADIARFTALFPDSARPVQARPDLVVLESE